MIETEYLVSSFSDRFIYGWKDELAWLRYNSLVYVVVQFYHRFKLYFPLFQTHYPTLPYPKTKENKI